MRFEFVKKTMETLLSEGVLTKSSSVLAICAGGPEYRLFSSLGFKQVTISNLDSNKSEGDRFNDYSWAFQDAENLTASDGAYDLVFVSDGLHHCRSPHRALLEMLRVARKGVIVFESRDGLLLRKAESMGMVETYEIAAVAGNSFEAGGVNNTDIPNFVYRWTEREFEKAISSFDPTSQHRFRYFYSLELPHERMRQYKGLGKRLQYRVATIAAKVFGALFPRQGNSFAMICMKPDPGQGLWPWIELGQKGPTISRSYVQERYR
jgi:ubiquinone/menaquinone biosynthesis C-methylase UbiE